MMFIAMFAQAMVANLAWACASVCVASLLSVVCCLDISLRKPYSSSLVDGLPRGGTILPAHSELLGPQRHLFVLELSSAGLRGKRRAWTFNKSLSELRSLNTGV
jgi:hypothetical protein